MAYSFPTAVSSDYDVDKAVYKSKVDDLVNRDYAYLRRPIAVELAEASESGASFVTKLTVDDFRIPRWANNYWLWCSLEVKVAASQTGEFRFLLGGTASTAVSFTNTTYANSSWAVVQVKNVDQEVEPESRNLQFQVRSTTGGNAFIRSASRSGLMFSHSDT